MKVLAIDAATRCGWAHSDGGSGEWNLTSTARESKGLRLVKFLKRLEEVQRTRGIELVSHEKVIMFPKRAQGSIVCAQLVGVLMLFCETRHIPYVEYSPGAIKKHATGKGNANKAAMIDAANARFGQVCGDNEADALWLLDLTQSERH